MISYSMKCDHAGILKALEEEKKTDKFLTKLTKSEPIEKAAKE
jgi:hypothetical protein